jgi:hypothetical protein
LRDGLRGPDTTKFRWAIGGKDEEGHSGQISLSHRGVEFRRGRPTGDQDGDRATGTQRSANCEEGRRPFIDTYVTTKFLPGGER